MNANQNFIDSVMLALSASANALSAGCDNAALQLCQQLHVKIMNIMGAHVSDHNWNEIQM